MFQEVFAVPDGGRVQVQGEAGRWQQLELHLPPRSQQGQ